ELESYAIYVYSPPMIAVEKLRAICQQMPQYGLRKEKSPRARDFYDIYLLHKHAGVDFGSQDVEELILPIFEAKAVSLNLIPLIPDSREFHRQDWPSVQDSVTGTLEPYDFYFDHLVEEIKKIKILVDKKDAK